MLCDVVWGKAHAALQAVEWLWPIWNRYHLVLRRTVQGSEGIFAQTSNGNKPAAAFTLLRSTGSATAVIPARFRGRGANKGWHVSWDERRVVAQAGSFRHEVRRLGGDRVWELVLRGKERRFMAGVVG